MTRPPEQGQMSFWEHLEELRSRLLWAAVSYIIGASAAWTLRDRIMFWLWKPFADSWRAQGISGDPTLNFAAPSDAFSAYFQLSLVAGLLMSAPVIFYQLWSFIAPGLYGKEKRIVLPFVFFSTVLFVGGGLFGWRVAFPITFDYFLRLAGDANMAGLAIRPVVMMNEYLDFVTHMLLAFGMIFELPLLILFLSIAGIVNYLQLIRFSRWFILIAFTVGAVLTPPDTTSQIVMSVPLCLLYFVSIGLAYMFGKRPTKDEIDADRARRKRLKDERTALRELRKQERAAEKRAGRG